MPIHSNIVLSICLLLFISAVQAGDAKLLLKRSDVAAKELNYNGVFAYQRGNELQSIRIIHRADEQGVIERLLSLSGVEREFIRTNDQVTCIYPEGRRPQANRQPLGHGFPSELLDRINAASAYYNSTLGQQGRVAAHKAQEIILTPNDNYRYGYQLWIGEDSDLLLQADLINEHGKVLEKFAFSAIDVNSKIDDQLLQPEMNGIRMTWNRKQVMIAINKEAKDSSNWVVTWLPQGFKLVGHQKRFAANGSPLEQRIYSDGLNAVSIFIEKIRAHHSHLHGGSQMGAVNAFGTIVNSHFVTVVGKVPARTVEKIGLAVHTAEN